jgi:hypothetical protein
MGNAAIEVLDWLAEPPCRRTILLLTCVPGVGAGERLTFISESRAITL